MKMTTKINTMLLAYAEKVEEAILAGEFEYLSDSDLTTDILVMGDRVSVWMGNGPDRTHCYKLCNNNNFIFPGHLFSQGHRCHDIITASMPDADEAEEHN